MLNPVAVGVDGVRRHRQKLAPQQSAAAIGKRAWDHIAAPRKRTTASDTYQEAQARGTWFTNVHDGRYSRGVPIAASVRLQIAATAATDPTLSIRAIAKRCGVSTTTAHKYSTRGVHNTPLSRTESARETSGITRRRVELDDLLSLALLVRYDPRSYGHELAALLFQFNAWTPEIIEYRADYTLWAVVTPRASMVFIDEASFDSGVLDRPHAYVDTGSETSLPVMGSLGAVAGETGRIQMFIAVWLGGGPNPEQSVYVETSRFENGTADTFARFAAGLAPLVPPGAVFLCDNARIHTAAQDFVNDLLAPTGGIMHVIPPYSPEFNPCELAFGLLKMTTRTDEFRHVRTLWGLEDALHLAVQQHVNLDFVTRAFVYCGYE